MNLIIITVVSTPRHEGNEDASYKYACAKVLSEQPSRQYVQSKLSPCLYERSQEVSVLLTLVMVW